MKLKNLTLRRIAGSQGFFIPVAHMVKNFEDGLEVGKVYDLEITPVLEEATP